MNRSKERPRRGRSVLRAVLALGVSAGLAGLAIFAFQLGLATGVAAAGSVLIVYAIPATLLDWPRPTFDDVIAAISAVFSAIGSFFSSLLDW